MKPASRAQLLGFWVLVILESALILSTIRLIGPAVEAAVQHRAAGFLLRHFLPWLGLFLPVTYLRSRKLQEVVRRHALWVAAATAVLLAVGVLRVGLRLENSRMFLPELRISVYRPNEVDRKCNAGPGCWTVSTDEHGLRNPSVRSRTPGGPVLAVIGDSYVFGQGVDGAETLPAQLERSLAAGHPGVRVVNAGIPGTSLSSFPAMASYVVSRYDAGALLVLSNVTDVALRDTNDRINLIRDDPLWRLYAVFGLDTAIDYFTLMSIPERPDAEAGQAIASLLDRLSDAAGERPLLLVSDWPRAYVPLLASWSARHPEAGWLDVTGDPDWARAEKIPGDPHWSVRGTATIAGMLREDAEGLLEKAAASTP